MQARDLALRAVALEDGRNHSALDTLALAHFRCGEYDLAVAVQQEAFDALGSPSGPSHDEWRARLEHYREVRAGRRLGWTLEDGWPVPPARNPADEPSPEDP